MKISLITVFFILAYTNQLSAQRNCISFNYQQQQLNTDPSLQMKMDAIESFTRQHTNTTDLLSRTEGTSVITIPVVVHILFHEAGENISDQQVINQIAILNRCFRRTNADSINTPQYFKPLAADCEIEFKLATSDPRKRNTNGIVRKYSPIVWWSADDKMKFSSETGDDAWDSKSYLNIWICNLDQVAGYSSVISGPANKDGVVLGFNIIGSTGASDGFNMGKTAVHEVGHWLNLKHLWGDTDCGDDLVDDTPKQSTYTVGCPSAIRISCGNGANGNMYMNYMDFTEDGCMNMFTYGQKARMRALFVSGGLRNSILSSTGLDAPLIFEAALPAESPKWLHPHLYPNPTTSAMTLDLAYDVRWMGKTIQVLNLQGQVVMQLQVTSKAQKIDVSKLQAGLYFLSAKKEDGGVIKQKFIKL